MPFIFLTGISSGSFIILLLFLVCLGRCRLLYMFSVAECVEGHGFAVFFIKHLCIAV